MRRTLMCLDAARMSKVIDKPVPDCPTFEPEDRSQWCENCLAASHDPEHTSVNGKPAPWDDRIWELWRIVVAAHFDRETREVARANFYRPRPYVDAYNRGSDKSGFVYVVGRNVCYHTWTGDVYDKKLGKDEHAST